MTRTKTHEIKFASITIDRFELAYNSTLNNLSRFEQVPSTNAALQILHLILECPRDNTSHALELWLFCEARRIFNNIKRAGLRQKAIHRQIVQRFVMQLSPEKRSNKAPYVQKLILSILEKMGFTG